ncbi:transcriptional regulator [Ancylothrix sp. C2]|uniref:transcriptional regulator n=1 Tax=Ancylothrix sp. D3o TaxID=2953691 RepID=UPI0021BAC592|nr:transcriptional regulator [Ancylothrix sp. D3o]MCT7948685.1 transcriptional regulator [Ancylothrix sp. D3o]
MKELKVPTSRSYHDYLISSLKSSESAASYLEVMLELEEEGREVELLRTGLKDVVDAYLQMNNLSDKAKLLYEKLDQLLSESGGEEIYTLIEFLDALGFGLGVKVKD